MLANFTTAPGETILLLYIMTPRENDRAGACNLRLKKNTKTRTAQDNLSSAVVVRVFFPEAFRYTPSTFALFHFHVSFSSWLIQPSVFPRIFCADMSPQRNADIHVLCSLHSTKEERVTPYYCFCAMNVFGNCSCTSSYIRM